MKCTHVCAAKTANGLITKLLIEPDFPSTADKIDEPRPDMNIKVTAFTVSKKFFYCSNYREVDIKIYSPQK